jgi:hypothetical protein
MRQFKVLRRFEYTSSEGADVLAKEGDNIYALYPFFPLPELIENGFIEEITPNENVNLSDGKESESVLDYDRNYNIHEAVNLLKNNDLKMVDSNYYAHWIYKEGDLVSDYSGTNIRECWKTEQILNLTFTLVKPQEEKVDRWIEIKNSRELCNAIVYNKIIGVFDKNDDTMRYRMDGEYEDSKISYLHECLRFGICVLKYLED